MKRARCHVRSLLVAALLAVSPSASAIPHPVAATAVRTTRSRTGGRLRSAVRTRAAILRQVRRIAATVRETHYVHQPHVDAPAGVYDFDCSSMLSFVLERSAPTALAAAQHRGDARARAQGYRSLDRLRAVNYYDQIAATPVGRTVDGWARVVRVGDIAPGDVIVWLRPASEAGVNHNTGHVMLAIARPEPMPDVPGAFLVRVADASAGHHGDDTRTQPGQTGFGEGTILLLGDRTGRPAGFGRLGRQSTELLTSQIAIGRPVG